MSYLQKCSRFAPRGWAACAILALLSSGVVFGASPKRISSDEARQAAVSKPAPAYPAIAKQLKMQGKVELDVFISESGSVEKVAAVSGNPVLTKAAQEALQNWKFNPIKEGDSAVKAVATLSFDFHL